MFEPLSLSSGLIALALSRSWTSFAFIVPSFTMLRLRHDCLCCVVGCISSSSVWSSSMSLIVVVTNGYITVRTCCCQNIRSNVCNCSLLIIIHPYFFLSRPKSFQCPSKAHLNIRCHRKLATP